MWVDLGCPEYPSLRDFGAGMRGCGNWNADLLIAASAKKLLEALEAV
jgi:hypothetical protein